MRNIILRNRYTLFATVVVLVFVLIVIEGNITKRGSGDGGFTSPLLDIRINN